MMKRRQNRSRRNRGSGPNTDQEACRPEKRKNLPAVFDIPGSALSGICHIEMAENREAVVGGCQGVVEYDEHTVKLAAGKMLVKFTGRNLQISILTRDSAVVTGLILSVEFLI